MTSQVASALETPALELPPSHGATVAFIYGHLREDIIRRSLCPGARLIEKSCRSASTSAAVQSARLCAVSPPKA